MLGDERAALVDTGMGADACLPDVVRGLTDKPVTVLLTHGDPDHAGGAPLFDEVWMSAADDKELRWTAENEWKWELIGKSLPEGELKEHILTHLTPAGRPDYRHIEDGQVFDLGGVALRAIALPGHTPGSMAFLDTAGNVLLGGDTVTRTPWMWMERCLPLARYLASLQKLRPLLQKDTAIYCGHAAHALPARLVDDLIRGSADVIAGNNAEDRSFDIFVPGYTPQPTEAWAHDCGGGMLVYNADHLE